MNDIENDMTDPIIELDNTKKTLEIQIAATKNLLRGQRSEMSKLEKMQLELNPNKPELLQAKQIQIEQLIQKLSELESDLKSLNRTRDDETEEKIQSALHKIKTDWIDKNLSSAYIIQNQEFVLIDEYSIDRTDQNIQVRIYSANEFIEFLSSILKIPSWHMPPARVKELFSRENRMFDIARYSINNSKWRNDRVYLPIKHMEKYFINNFELTVEDGQDYSPFFDMLMHSLSGGKKENKEHIERWLLHKVKNYRKQVTTPDIAIVGHVGGNGKGIIQAIIRLMIPAALVGKANAKTLNGNFNAIMIGKLIVFFDDQNSKEIPLEIVKQLAGSDYIIFEAKGKDQYEGEKTHSSAWFSNVLPFRLTPGGQEGGVDRRFSIMRTNITFLESIREYYKDVYDQTMTVEESKDIAEIGVRDELLNRIEIAKYFKALEIRYPEVDKHYTLKPLHGEDYHYFLGQQQSSIETIWDKLVVPQIKRGSCVPTFVISKLIEYLDQRPVGNKRMGKLIEELINTTKLDVKIERVYLDIQPTKMSKPKQCNIIRPILDSDYVDRSFNWSLVSNQHFSDIMGPNEKLFNDDNCIFGQTTVVGDDEDDELDLFEK
jgi:phage/plasmid-associated DNA primase